MAAGLASTHSERIRHTAGIIRARLRTGAEGAWGLGRRLLALAARYEAYIGLAVLIYSLLR